MHELPAPSAAHLQWLRRRAQRRRRIRLCQLALLVALFGVWELSTQLGWSDGFLISSPSRMVRTFVQLCSGGELLVHIGTSCLETVVGFTLGTALGTLVAVCMWWSDTLSQILDPYLVVLNALPKTALGPIFIVWMGAGIGSIIAMTLAISLIVTILNMYVGFLSTDGEKIRLMRSLGAKRSQVHLFAVTNPLSSYYYVIDDAYRAKLEETFWSTISFETFGGVLYDTEVMDIDGDGTKEVCNLSVGPTSGRFSFVLKATDLESGEEKYRDVFYYNHGTPCFALCEDGAVRVKMVTHLPEQTHFFDIEVQGGHVLLLENGKPISDVIH